ncbi:di-heme oxidoredictase family protein [Meiothermus sp. Pnk-1]
MLHDGRARTLEEAILWHGGRQGTSTSCWPS